MSKRILIYYTGTIGDTIIALPAFQMIRQHYPDAHITLLSALFHKFSAPLALLEPTDYIDDFLSYILPKRRFMRLLMAVKLIYKLRRMHFDEVIYLARDDDPERKRRDRRFFSYAGIRLFRGFDKNTVYERKNGVAQRLVDTLAEEGIGTPYIVENYGDFQLTEAEKQKAGQWFESLKIPTGCIPVVYGMGGKTQPSQWALEKHREVLTYAIKEFHLFPLFFGDDSSREKEEAIIRTLQCGVRVASQGFTLRESIAVMSHCSLYIGHDTGTMHMASAAGLPCLGIFSARNPEGKWYPPGKNNIFLRHHCECEGCGLFTCADTPARCIDAITVEDVLSALNKILEKI